MRSTRCFGLWALRFKVLRGIGFGPRFREWIDFLLYPQAARVMLNGEPVPSVWHRKGLRQGETLSPMLFVLVIDAFNRFFARAREFGLLLDFAPRDLITTVSFMQTKSSSSASWVWRSILSFATCLRSSGMHRGCTPTMPSAQCPPSVVRRRRPLRRHRLCSLLPRLGLRKPSSVALQPLVDRIMDRLPN